MILMLVRPQASTAGPIFAADVETVQQLLGHAELQHVMPYLAVYPRKIRDMFAAVL